MTFGVWYERDSGKAGLENVGDFLKRESSKGYANPHFVL